MNRKYHVVDGHAVVLDDDNNYACTYECNEYLDDRLIIENQVEYLENKISEYDNFLKYKDSIREKNRKSLNKFWGITLSIVFILNIILSIKFGSPVSSISNITNIISNLVIFAIPSSLIAFTFVEKLVMGPTKIEKNLKDSRSVAKMEVRKLQDKLYDISIKSNFSKRIEKTDEKFTMIDDRKHLKNIDQICQLRLRYLKDKKRLVKLAKNGMLNAYFYDLGFTNPDVVAAVENDVISDVNRLQLSNKNYNK